MKCVVFSDIHGNYLAFKAMLKDVLMHSVDAFICCGDIAGYYYDAAAIVEILRSISNIYLVKGNHDVMYTKAAKDRVLKKILCEKYGNAYQSIREDVCRYLSVLPERISFKVDDQRILLVHGSEQDALQGRIYPDTQLDFSSEYDVIFCGHTHYPMVRRCGKTLLINPGSLGQPRDGTGFSYGIYDTSFRTWERRTVNICMEPLLDQIKMNDPNNHYLKSVLLRGENQCYEKNTHHGSRG